MKNLSTRIKELPADIMVWLTKVDRMKVVAGVDFQWSSKSWTHNIFRVYELIFWRRDGIRCESYRNTASQQIGVTYEAKIAIFESQVRAWFVHDFLGRKVSNVSTGELSPFKVTDFPLARPQIAVPIFASLALAIFHPASLFITIPIVSGAIAIDTARSTGEETTDPTTYSYTCTGSNLVLIISGVVQRVTSTGWPAASAITYNSVQMDAQDVAAAVCPATTAYTAIYHLLSPSTGSNTVSINWVNTIQNAFPITASYSGVKQTGFPDSTATAVSSGTGTSFNATTTVVASNCWLIACGKNDQAAPTISGGSATNRANDGNSVVLADSNATVGTGSQTITYSFSPAANWSYVVASFAPVAAAGPANLKTYNTNAKANIKTINTNAIANVKTLDTNA